MRCSGRRIRFPGFTRARVLLEQIINVTPMGTEELRADCGVRSWIAEWCVTATDADGVELTGEGLEYARRLPPISEPPLFQDI